MPDGKVVFQITGDNSGVISALNDTTAEIRKAGSDWDSESSTASDNISNNLIGGFKAVAASAAFTQIAKMLVDFGVESINVASDLEEVQNVVDVTFGAQGAAKIEEWAKNAANNFGLTELQAKRYASTLGAMMKSSGMAGDEVLDMSMAMAGLAADMASFYNLPFDVAFDKIRAGISGETMPLKALGIDMSETTLKAFALAEGFETEYDKMEQAEKTLVRYRYLMKATADAQGDFARTSDGYANSQRRIQTGLETLKAQVGEVLLPIATQISNAIADFLEMLTTKPTSALSTASEEIGDAVGQATEAQGILGYMDQLYQKYGDMATSTDEWRIALEQLKTVFPDVTQYIDEQTGMLTLTNEELKAYIENVKQAAIEEARRKAISDIAQKKVNAERDYYTAEVQRDISQSKADEARNSIISFIQQFEKDYTGMGKTMEQILSDARAYNQSENGVGNQAYNDAEAMLSSMLEIYNTETANVKTYSTEMETLSETLASANAEYEIAVAALERMTSAGNAAANALSSVRMNSGQYYNYYYSGMGVNGSHALGLSYVPFDNYIARLHEGEGILTAEENKVWQDFKNGAKGGEFDYDALGGVMRDNVRPGGNVYLDGHTVGKVISARQANSFRALERSGWQG